MNLYLLRYPNPQGTPGDLIIGRRVFCHTLEDILRLDGVKIPGETCIPAGVYPVILYMSPRFGRIVPLLQNVPDFDMIEIHGGTTTLDVKGCIVAAYNIVGLNMLQGRASDDIVALMRANDEEKTITIVNT
jgi:hypothetical protein